MPRVTSIPDADTVVLRWGDDGTPYSVREGDEEAGGIAFIKCVAEGLARGDVIEDDVELLVAKALIEDAMFLTLFPTTGNISYTHKGVVWSQEEGLSELQQDLNSQLPAYDQQSGSSWYVQDISVDGNKALICHYGSSGTEYFVADVTGEQLSAQSSWVAVEQDYVAKEGRVSNLAALQAIHEAVGAVIHAEMAQRQKDPSNDGNDPPEETDKALDYIVTKADGEQMYTFGPLYAPDRKDAHGEYTDSDTLAKAVHDYVQACVDQGDNRLNIQHSDDKAAGRWVEVCAWPYETTVKMKVPGEGAREVTLPAGTIYMGIQWDETVWPDVKKGKLTGLSLGGRAMRVVSEDNPKVMGDKTATLKPGEMILNLEQQKKLAAVMGEQELAQALGLVEASTVCEQFTPSEDNPDMCATCGISQDAHDSGDPS